MASSIEREKKALAILFLIMGLDEILKRKRLKKAWIRSWVSRREGKGCIRYVNSMAYWFCDPSRIINVTRNFAGATCRNLLRK